MKNWQLLSETSAILSKKNVVGQELEILEFVACFGTIADLNSTGKCLGLTVLLIGSVWNGHNGECVHILKPAIIIIRIMPVLVCLSLLRLVDRTHTSATTPGFPLHVPSSSSHIWTSILHLWRIIRELHMPSNATQQPPEPKPPPPPTDTGPQHRQIFGGWVFCVVGEFGRDPCLLVLLGMELPMMGRVKKTAAVKIEINGLCIRVNRVGGDSKYASIWRTMSPPFLTGEWTQIWTEASR
nr:hypothetical protein Iba_chr13aCG9780 [Ipomoea batatas]